MSPEALAGVDLARALARVRAWVDAAAPMLDDEREAFVCLRPTKVRVELQRNGFAVGSAREGDRPEGAPYRGPDDPPAAEIADSVLCAVQRAERFCAQNPIERKAP